MSLTVLSVAYPLAPVGPDAAGGAEQILHRLDEAPAAFALLEHDGGLAGLQELELVDLGRLEGRDPRRSGGRLAADVGVLARELPGGGGARVCTKYDTAADGTEFVGVGIAPDYAVAPTVADVRAGRDRVLEAAVERLRDRYPDRRPSGDRPAPRPRPPALPPPDALGPDEELVAGRRPVEEAFVARRPARRLLVVPNRRAALEKLVLHATNLRIPIVEVEGGSLTALAGFDGHQGIALVVEPRRFATLDDILARAAEQGEPPFILVLDSLEDPHNVGSLLRSAEGAGVHGVIFPTHRQAPISPSAVKASAGAVEHLLLYPAEDLPGTLTDLHSRGVRVVVLIGREESVAVDTSPYGCANPGEPVVYNDLVYPPCLGAGLVIALTETGSHTPPNVQRAPGTDPDLSVLNGWFFASAPNGTAGRK